MNLFIILYLPKFIVTLLVIALIYFGIRIVTRYVLPLLINRGIKNMQSKMQDQQHQNQRTSRTDGEVTIEKNKKNNQGKSQSEGDYVDFEEVD